MKHRRYTKPKKTNPAYRFTIKKYDYSKPNAKIKRDKEILELYSIRG